jgi:hypothetical protein
MLPCMALTLTVRLRAPRCHLLAGHGHADPRQRDGLSGRCGEGDAVYGQERQCAYATVDGRGRLETSGRGGRGDGGGGRAPCEARADISSHAEVMMITPGPNIHRHAIARNPPFPNPASTFMNSDATPFVHPGRNAGAGPKSSRNADPMPAPPCSRRHARNAPKDRTG